MIRRIIIRRERRFGPFEAVAVYADRRTVSYALGTRSQLEAYANVDTLFPGMDSLVEFED